MTGGPPMHERLPSPWREWVIARADAMGLPDADSYLVLLVRLDHQRHGLSPSPDGSIPVGDASD